MTKIIKIIKALPLILSALSPFSSFAEEADVIKVDFSKNTENNYQFSVTVNHADTGWEHYANKWEIFDTKGNLLAARTLVHPHVDEQPFTRSLSNIEIPDDVKTVIIKAYDSQHQYGGKALEIELN